MKIACYEGPQEELLKAFKDVQYPAADTEHYGSDLPAFRKEHRTLVATDDSGIIGFLTLIVDTGVANIDSLLVHEQQRRVGIGAALLEEAEALAKELGCHLMKLETGDDWAARKFYEKHGYVLKAELKQYYGRRDFVLMDKSI